MINKRKILNDPIHGFITIPYGIALDIIDHPYFQRLRRIIQLGLSNLVYPGANQSRFQHAIGAMHLMQQAIEVLRQKGIEITDEEAKGVSLAILLHDVGHGPFSHALEHALATGVRHEEISLFIMQKLNEEFKGELDLCIKIFRGEYPKKFLHQLVSSQLDMDRLDYLRRDSFFSGVSEGIVGSQRLIKMLTVVNDELAIEEKGIYSVEKFLVARRLMYWQVYLHKTVVSAEFMLVNVLRRAREIALSGAEIFTTPSLKPFLYEALTIESFAEEDRIMNAFIHLDDYDILTAIKVWCGHDDLVLRKLSEKLINRELFKIQIDSKPFTEDDKVGLLNKIAEKYSISPVEASYFLIDGELNNSAYSHAKGGIKISYKDGRLVDISKASDSYNIEALSIEVKKYFLCAMEV